MTTLAEHADRVTEQAERAMTAGGFLNSVVAVRGDRPYLIVLIRDIGADMGEVVTSVAGSGADTAVIAIDTYIARVPLNPDTGRPWQDGGGSALEDYFLAHPGDRRVVEGVVVLAGNRAGDLAFVISPYLRHEHAGGGDTFTWLAKERGTDGALGVGGLAELLRTSMLAPSFAQWMAAQGKTSEIAADPGGMAAMLAAAMPGRIAVLALDGEGWWG